MLVFYRGSHLKYSLENAPCKQIQKALGCHRKVYWKIFAFRSTRHYGPFTGM
jgi:hypothetical protein